MRLLEANYKFQYSINDFLILEDRAIYFAKDKDFIDCVKIAKIANTNNIYISWFGILLLGSKESTDNPLYFGEIDSKNELDETKPIYYLESNDEFDLESNSTDSNTYQNNTNSSHTNTNRAGNCTLQVFLNDSSLTLLNYSLLDSSLNIKLECKSQESKAIQEKEQAQMDCHDFLQKSRNDDMISTAMLHPVLEDNEIKCPHGGVVKLKSNKGKPFKSKGISMILESDLLNSSIIGCTNNILGVPTPCTLVSTILPTARALKKYNDDYPIMQDLVSSGCLSDKGFPLIATPKPNTFKINSPKPIQTNTQSKESIESSLHLTKPILRLHYKVNKYQKDNLPIYKIKLQEKQLLKISGSIFCFMVVQERLEIMRHFIMLL